MDNEGRIFTSNNVFKDKQMKVSIGEIFQVSELSLVRSGIIDEHIQQYDEITYIISGKAKISSDGGCDVVKAGDIHLIRQNEKHCIEADFNENLKFICIAFRPDLSNKIVEEYAKLLDMSPVRIVNDNGGIKVLAELLVREFYDSDEHSSIMIDGYLTQIIIMLARILSGRKYIHPENPGNRSAQYILHKTLRYIDREYLQIVSVKSVADAMCYSEYYLSHLFSEKMQMTIKEYITKKKISYAADLLDSSELSIDRIAEQLNFASSHSFRRAFKKYTGLTPSEYKKVKKDN